MCRLRSVWPRGKTEPNSPRISRTQPNGSALSMCSGYRDHPPLWSPCPPAAAMLSPFAPDAGSLGGLSIPAFCWDATLMRATTHAASLPRNPPDFPPPPTPWPCFPCSKCHTAPGSLSSCSSSPLLASPLPPSAPRVESWGQGPCTSISSCPCLTPHGTAAL